MRNGGHVIAKISGSDLRARVLLAWARLSFVQMAEDAAGVLGRKDLPELGAGPQTRSPTECRALEDMHSVGVQPQRERSRRSFINFI